MNQRTGPAEEATALAEKVAEALAGRTVAAAESVTSGNVAAALAAAPGAGTWPRPSLLGISPARRTRWHISRRAAPRRAM